MSAPASAAHPAPVQPTVNTRFQRADWTSIAVIGGVVLLLHLVGWGVLILAVAPQHITLGSAGVFGVGLGVTAYLLGVRHAFDADHIAVIDNTTRKLVGEGKRSLSAGFWFSLGHSSVVFGLALLLALGVRALVGPVQDEGSPMLTTLGLIGSLVAGTFLILIGVTNLFTVFGIAKVLTAMRTGDFDALDGIFMARAYGWAFLKPVRKVYYNLTVTVLSVIVALAIGVVLLAGLLAERLGVETGPLAFVGSADLEMVGFMIVGLFVAAWLIALAIWRFGRVEERWSGPPVVQSRLVETE